MDREAWRAAVHGVTVCQTRLSDWTELNWTAAVAGLGSAAVLFKMPHNSEQHTENEETVGSHHPHSHLSMAWGLCLLSGKPGGILTYSNYFPTYFPFQLSYLSECKMCLHQIFEVTWFNMWLSSLCNRDFRVRDMCVGCVCVCVCVFACMEGDSDINAQRWEIFPNRKVSVEMAKLDVAFVSEIYRILELESYLGATDSKITPSARIAPVVP